MKRLDLSTERESGWNPRISQATERAIKPVSECNCTRSLRLFHFPFLLRNFLCSSLALEWHLGRAASSSDDASLTGLLLPVDTSMGNRPLLCQWLQLDLLRRIPFRFNTTQSNQKAANCIVYGKKKPRLDAKATRHSD